MVVLKMLGQPHSSVIVWSSTHSGRAQNPVIVGQLEPVVSVTVTQVGDPEVDVVGQQRTTVGQVPKTAARQANVEDRIFECNRGSDGNRASRFK
jgi:hypothetical protein